MNFDHLITIISLLTTSILSIYSIRIQSEKKKLKHIEEEYKDVKKEIVTALYSIQGYQEFIRDVAIEKNKTVDTLKGEIHSNKNQFFKSTRFLQPNNIQELINKYKF